MNYDEYYSARSIVKEILEKDLLGPLEKDEVINDYPISYYVMGKLYPQQCVYQAERSNAEDIGELDDEPGVASDNGREPSSIGVSFSLKKEAKDFHIVVSAAKYIKLDEMDEISKKPLWKREGLFYNIDSVEVSDLESRRRINYEISEGLSIEIFLHKIYNDGSRTVSVTLINTSTKALNTSRIWVNENTFFQPYIRISGDAQYFTDIRKNVKLNLNKEVLEMEMLYSKYREYSTGHGCATSYHIENNQMTIETSMLPNYELRQMMPAEQKNNLLSMKYLAGLAKAELISQLSTWISDYKRWIDQLAVDAENIKKEYRVVAKDNIKKCNDTYSVIVKSINCLQDDNVYKAFKYANEAMFNQRKQVLGNRGISVDDDKVTWYPFQLAFFLQEIVSFADPKSEERKNVDLLWFPTGGGKTEAYLGIAAFYIFLRRLRNSSKGSGVSVIMRYTLRLLTFQQFERATAMICACEILRKRYSIPGDEISIGLWAGKALTPNSIEMASKILDGYSDPDNESSNPRQLKKCPWCGKTLPENAYSCIKAENRMYIKCPNRTCDFRDGLPVHLIDEEIYKFKPSFLVATVDKFAQVAHKEETFALFGKGTDNVPPELIIQDELHLISGPLGTITGIYEAAFKKMYSNKGINAKIIASTATIRNASEQIKSLYCTDYTQFPPQGLDADNSYFAIKSTREKKPARLYMGCMGTGTSSTTVMIRVMAATLYATRFLETKGYDDEIIDSFWSITSYFNTLRELGGAIIRVIDNVQDRFSYLKETKLNDYYPIDGGQTRYDNYIELTSREKSENIGKIIQEDLMVRYSKNMEKMPIDFILSSNMISVGIDIARLNTMLVMGQPHTTAEYIQATSRVGRETPGLVFTMYNYMRSRDKSHFEQFNQYHEAFYKYVEATSVTPFAERARDRALQTLFIMLCRFYIDELRSNESAGRFNRNIRGLSEIKNYILSYVKIVDPDEYENVEYELEEIVSDWESLAEESPDMTYRKSPFQTTPALFAEDYNESSRFRVLNSMRSVETSIQVITRE